MIFAKRMLAINILETLCTCSDALNVSSWRSLEYFREPLRTIKIPRCVGTKLVGYRTVVKNESDWENSQTGKMTATDDTRPELDHAEEPFFG